MEPQWIPNGLVMASHGCPRDSLWMPYGFAMGSSQIPYGLPRDSLWILYGFFGLVIDSLLILFGLLLDPLWNPCGFQLVPYAFLVNAKWLGHGAQ